ncbi:MAG TPA: DedA family protein [Ktedonobacterales bacterium]|nr:DedA family protein [Ktedonobacterales bacterium]
MLTSLTDFLFNAITGWYKTFGYGGIILAMALESCLIPLPSEIVMPLAGSFVSSASASSIHFNIFGVALAGAIGSVIGSAAAYWIGAYGGRPFIMNYGKYILVSRHDFDVADRQFIKYGSAITFFSRLLPIIRTYISLPAGISRMNFGKFVLYTFLGSLPWCLALAFAGEKLGEHAKSIGNTLHGLDAVIAVLLVAGVVAYVWRHIRKERAYDANLRAQNTSATEKMPRMGRDDTTEKMTRSR